MVLKQKKRKGDWKLVGAIPRNYIHKLIGELLKNSIIRLQPERLTQVNFPPKFPVARGISRGASNLFK